MSRLMLCGATSWLILSLVAPVRADDTEDKAVAFVEKLGGKVTRDDKLPGKPVIGVNLGMSVISTKVTDAGLKELAPLKNLSTLDLSGTAVTDAGLKELAPLKNLTSLDLFRTAVTDAGLKELAPLKHLTSLNLAHTKVTDAGLKELAQLHNLTSLDLRVTHVTQAGMEELQKALPKCKISR